MLGTTNAFKKPLKRIITQNIYNPSRSQTINILKTLLEKEKNSSFSWLQDMGQ